MSLGVAVLATAVVFVVVVAARPLWDIRRQLLTTLDWRDLTVLLVAMLALLLPIVVFTIALPHVPWLENVIPRSLLSEERRPLASDQANLAQSLYHQGEVYRSQGRYVEAEALFKQTMAIVEKHGGLTQLDVSLP